MCKFPRVSVTLCILLSCTISSHALFCWMNAQDDLNAKQPLLLQAATNEFFYPQKCNSRDLKLKFYDNLRVACPEDSLIVSSSKLNVSQTNLRCYGLSYFEVEGQSYPTEIDQIACSKSPVAIAEDTKKTCPDNGTILRVGFELTSAAFLPTIEEICFDKVLAKTNWAHSKIVMSVRKRQVESNNTPLYQTGEFFDKVENLPAAYTRDAQRTRLMELIMDQATVDKYIPANGDEYLVEGMLAPWADMFYRAQQESTYQFVNTVPIWKSIHEGNWKLVEDVVRKITSQQCTNLDVWTGGYQVLSLKNKAGGETNVTLAKTEGMNSTAVIPVPRFLFKYVVDTVHNRGVVFVTLNDPKKTAIAPEDQICEARIACTTLYPQFNFITSGYTYCCSIDSTSKFYPIAEKLGLPLFPTAQPLA